MLLIFKNNQITLFLSFNAAYLRYLDYSKLEQVFLELIFECLTSPSPHSTYAKPETAYTSRQQTTFA